MRLLLQIFLSHIDIWKNASYSSEMLHNSSDFVFFKNVPFSSDLGFSAHFYMKNNKTRKWWFFEYFNIKNIEILKHLSFLFFLIQKCEKFVLFFLRILLYRNMQKCNNFFRLCCCHNQICKNVSYSSDFVFSYGNIQKCFIFFGFCLFIMKYSKICHFLFCYFSYRNVHKCVFSDLIISYRNMQTTSFLLSFYIDIQQIFTYL